MATKIVSSYLTDEKINDLFFDRDERALNETGQKYGRLFFSISSGILENREDAEECVNDTYLKLWCSIPPERPKSLMAYGARIVKNLSINRAEFKGARRRGGDVIFEELDEAIPAGDGISDEGEITSAIEHFLRGTDRESRVAFVLRYWYMTPLEEIARRLGCGVPGVKSRLFRTRQKLKEHLEKEGISL